MMKTESVVSSGQGIFSIVLAVVAAVFIYGMATNRDMPLVSNIRGALGVLFVLGFVMCMTGGLGNKAGKEGFSWLSPFVILGILLGGTAIYVAYAGLAGRSLPFVTGERGAFILLASIVAIKWIMSRIHAMQLG